MTEPTKELAFQNDVIAQKEAAGRTLGDPARCDRALALYSKDAVGNIDVRQWQPEGSRKGEVGSLKAYTAEAH